MTIHLTIWWLWGPLAAIYAFGVIAGMGVTMIADDVWWWQRPLILIWPVALAGILAWRSVLFLAGR